MQDFASVACTDRSEVQKAVAGRRSQKADGASLPPATLQQIAGAIVDDVEKSV